MRAVCRGSSPHSSFLGDSRHCGWTHLLFLGRRISQSAWWNQNSENAIYLVSICHWVACCLQRNRDRVRDLCSWAPGGPKDSKYLQIEPLAAAEEHVDRARGGARGGQERGQQARDGPRVACQRPPAPPVPRGGPLVSGTAAVWAYGGEVAKWAKLATRKFLGVIFLAFQKVR